MKGVWRMPWLSEAKKDVTSCENLRGGANNLRSAGLRMGQPILVQTGIPYFIVRGEPAELKHLSRRRRRKQ